MLIVALSLSLLASLEVNETDAPRTAKHMIDVLQENHGLSERQARTAFTRSQFRQFTAIAEQHAAVDAGQLGRGELHDAVLSPGACARTLELLDAGADLEAADAQGITPLMLAAGKGWLSRLLPLLAMGADVHAPDNMTQGTALVHAAIAFNYGAVGLLLAAGASANVRIQTNAVPDSDGVTRVPGVDVRLLQMVENFEGEDDEEEEERQRVVWLLADDTALISREGWTFRKEKLREAALELGSYGWSGHQRQQTWRRALEYEAVEQRRPGADEVANRRDEL